MNVSTRATITVRATPEAVFDLVNDPERTPDVFVAHGPIVGVTGAQVVSAGPLAEGKVRHITTADGATLTETMLTFDRACAVRYRLEGLARPFSFLVRHGDASWRFTPEEGSTRVEWTYTFELTTPLAWPLAALIVGTVFRGWMNSCLHRVNEILNDSE